MAYERINEKIYLNLLSTFNHGVNKMVIAKYDVLRTKTCKTPENIFGLVHLVLHYFNYE